MKNWIKFMYVVFYSQLLENSQLTLMEEWRGWCATFTIWAIIAHPTSSERHTTANLEFSSNFDSIAETNLKRHIGFKKTFMQ